MRNHFGTVIGAWTNRFFSSNSFCAEIKAAIQAFQIVEDLWKKYAQFEGDARQVILALRGLDQYLDWKAQPKTLKGRMFLPKHSFWHLNYVNCNYNLLNARFIGQDKTLFFQDLL